VVVQEVNPMLGFAEAREIGHGVAIEVDVMNRGLYGRPLDHAAAMSALRSNSYW
jgi:hypothetical protein